jgi:hypothetical protein
VLLAATVRPSTDRLPADGVFAIDVLTVHPSSSGVVLRVGEIKAYPDRGGHTDPGELASARAQAGLYVHVLRLAIDAAGLCGAIRVADDGFLVLTRAGGNRPSVRAGEDLRWQARRAAVAFERFREAAARLGVPSDADEARRLAAVREATTAYDEACVSFCPRAQRCRDVALASGDAAVLGRDVRRLLGSVRLARALELLEQRDTPRTDAEAELMRQMAEDLAGKVVAS